MPFCQQCGSQASDTADFCFNCGADVASTAIALPGISPGWKARFAVLQKAGGVDMPQSIALTMGERAMVRFNLLAFLFGPAYYAVKGMWRKALTLCALSLVLMLLFRMLLAGVGLGGSGFVHTAYLIAPALFATRANVDYFTKMVLRDDGWL
ncbi:zinc-ribbon domain-containing protein [Pseudoduganella namucuonensis]|uniref:Zinc-ribbon domain-containing protein n=2 Tax=Pseudoduganella namucuonensis TaxID=1035707 RepID=A0A1I7EZB6_9BURK|nr:zinc-ribbon domain-containing protein [Pseudoduganella namucuonensis]